MKSQPFERLASLALTTAIHAAAGLALLLFPPPGGTRKGNAAQDRGGILLVTLIPLDHGKAASAASPAGKQEEVTTPTPVTRSASQHAARTSDPNRTTGTETPADFSTPAPRPDTGSASAALSGSHAITYRDQLFAHIARFRQYPAEAHRNGLEGSVEVRFILNRDGTIKDAWIVSSSGRQIFDREALAAIHRAVPMPVIPSDLPTSLDISMPIDFEIN